MTKSKLAICMRASPFVATLCGAFVPTPIWARCAGDIGIERDAKSTDRVGSGSHGADNCEQRPNMSREPVMDLRPSSATPSMRLDLVWNNPVKLAQPAGSERSNGRSWDWGDSTLAISGFRVKTHPYAPGAPNLLTGEDRSALWGGDIAFDRTLGPQDSFALSFDGALGKQRSAFTPQVAHRFSSQSLGATLVWHHDRSFALAAGLRMNRTSTASTPLLRLAARTAGSPLEASGAHFTATYLPFFAPTKVGEREGLKLTLDAFLQRLSASDAAIFNGNGGGADHGITVTLKARF